MLTDLTTLCVASVASIREGMAQMERNRMGIVLVVDGEQRLLGTVTDGDVRRAVLAHVDLAQEISVLLDLKKGSPYAQAISAPVGTDPSAQLAVLQQHSILQLPLVDENNRVVALATLDEFIPQQDPLPQAVVMAGGLGSRLRPLTNDVPKSMLPVGDRPLLEIIIGQLRGVGIKHVNVAVHHQSEQITQHFGDGSEFGVEIAYVNEGRPLGTAGAIGLMETLQETLLIINGDVITQVDFRAMLAYHHEHGADLTVAVQQHDMQVPYGVVECEGISVQRLTEKPLLKFFINAGIYLLEPSVQRLIPNGEPTDMTEIIERLLRDSRPVVAFPIHEGWIDIGQQADYQKAQDYAEQRNVIQ